MVSLSDMTVKKFRHPSKLDLGHKEFEIVQRSLKKESLYGCVEFSKSLITIDPNQSPEDYRSTLLHEICHVGLDLFGLGDDDEMPTFGNEYITAVTSNMMVLMAGLNPDLFRFIFSRPNPGHDSVAVPESPHQSGISDCPRSDH